MAVKKKKKKGKKSFSEVIMHYLQFLKNVSGQMWQSCNFLLGEVS